jgi:hypothetical protein
MLRAKRSSHSFLGDRDRRAWGSQNSVIDGKRRQLKCHPPAVHWVTEKRQFEHSNQFKFGA